jgi:hypothetical protein
MLNAQLTAVPDAETTDALENHQPFPRGVRLGATRMNNLRRTRIYPDNRE